MVGAEETIFSLGEGHGLTAQEITRPGEMYGAFITISACILRPLFFCLINYEVSRKIYKWFSFIILQHTFSFSKKFVYIHFTEQSKTHNVMNLVTNSHDKKKLKDYLEDISSYVFHYGHQIEGNLTVNTIPQAFLMWERSQRYLVLQTIIPCPLNNLQQNQGPIS